MRTEYASLPLLAALWCCPVGAQGTAASCDGQLIPEWNGVPHVWKMQDSIATYARLNINIDGYGKAYHRNNYQTDAVIHLCNAGKVYLPDGSSYHGSVDNPTCTGRFMNDVAKIEAAGWKDPKVGAVRWYGVLGTGSATVKGRKIQGVVPVRQAGGYYISPTALFDRSISNAAQQDRYVHPLIVPAAVIPGSLQQAGIRLGSFGVAISPKTNVAVPFVVGDSGPRVGEGTPALARQLAGLPLLDTISRKNRWAGQVATPTILWVFFGDEAQPYDHASPHATVAAAKQAYERWGGRERLKACEEAVPPR